eukprot:4422452-Pyramimonas_sp.AAC.1
MTCAAAASPGTTAGEAPSASASRSSRSIAPRAQVVAHSKERDSNKITGQPLPGCKTRLSTHTRTHT